MKTTNTPDQAQLKSIKEFGAAARSDGGTFHENLFYFESGDQFDAWFARCEAWAAGWIERDAGRDEWLTARLNNPAAW